MCVTGLAERRGLGLRPLTYPLSYFLTLSRTMAEENSLSPRLRDVLDEFKASVKQSYYAFGELSVNDSLVENFHDFFEPEEYGVSIQQRAQQAAFRQSQPAAASSSSSMPPSFASKPAA